MGSLGHGYIEEVMVLANTRLLEYINCTELSSMYPCPEVIREEYVPPSHEEGRTYHPETIVRLESCT